VCVCVCRGVSEKEADKNANLYSLLKIIIVVLSITQNSGFY
jgi:bacterioferritin-associated ferredoxin